SCAKCKGKEQDQDQNLLIFCAACDRGFHTRCLDKKKSKDVVHWVCQEC
ncbi:unnamed protein product, partial [Ectocarpus sp. 12 AP-2014]